MNIVANILNKHLGAVHNSSPLTIVQRKAINILLKNADSKINEDIEHIISIRDLMKGIGWSSSSKTPDNLKECLSELVSIKIQWNIFDIDKKSKWITSTLLASVAIKDGNVYYSYSHPLRALLSQPNVYAKLDLGIQKLFKGKYSMLIWEYVSGELSRKKSETLTTDWLSYQQILKLTYLETSIYENRYSFFLERVIEKSLDEINAKSDVNVGYETTSNRGKITYIRFKVQKKKASNLLLDFFTEAVENDPLKERLIKVGFSKELVNEVKRNHTDLAIEQALDYFLAEFNNPNMKIKNPVAFFKKALEAGWVLPEVMQQRKGQGDEDTEKNSLLAEIVNLDEPETIKNIRHALLCRIGSAPYKTWIHPLAFKMEGDSVHVIATNRFLRDRVEIHYRQDLENFIRKHFDGRIEKIEYLVENERLTQEA